MEFSALCWASYFILLKAFSLALKNLFLSRLQTSNNLSCRAVSRSRLNEMELVVKSLNRILSLLMNSLRISLGKICFLRSRWVTYGRWALTDRRLAILSDIIPNILCMSFIAYSVSDFCF